MKSWRPVRQTLLVLGFLYLLYLTKTALGINISDRYRAPDLVKLPLKALVLFQ